MSKKIIKDLLFLTILSVLVYFSISKWHSGFLGLILLTGYLAFTALGARLVLAKFFNLSARAWRIRVLGMFLSLFTLGLFGSMLLTFYRLGEFGIAVCFFVNGILYLTLEIWAQISGRHHEDMPVEDLKVIEAVPNSKLALLAYVIFVVVGFYLLTINVGSSVITSPWQVIDARFIYVFFIATFFLGVIIFAKIPAKLILFLIIAQSFLLHAYLPLSHQLFYGADGWRHLAEENKILQTNEPQVNIRSTQVSYYQYRATDVILGRLLNIDQISLKKWLEPIVWSIVFPILLFEVGLAFGWGKKESLFFTWLGFLPFAWNFAGSISLPVGYGFLGFLFLFLLIIRRLRAPRVEQALILFGLGAFFVFGYILYFVLFWVLWFGAEMVWVIFHKFKNNKILAGAMIGFVAAAVLPAVEIATHFSNWQMKTGLLSGIKQLLGNFFAWYLAAGPRPHLITTGNVIFNQIPLADFVPNLFLSWRWGLLLFMMAFFVFTFWGWIKSWCADSARMWVAIFAPALFASYILSRYFLAGENILTRRLDAVLALFLMILVFVGLRGFLFRGDEINLKKTIAAIVIFSLAITTSYSLGPNLATVSTDENTLMQGIARQEKNKTHHCVLADTLPLLALEAASQRKIVGGGFPMEDNYAQVERVKLYNDITKNPAPEIVAIAKAITGAKDCWLVVDANQIQMNDYAQKFLINNLDDTLIFKF